MAGLLVPGAPRLLTCAQLCPAQCDGGSAGHRPADSAFPPQAAACMRCLSLCLQSAVKQIHSPQHFEPGKEAGCEGAHLSRLREQRQAAAASQVQPCLVLSDRHPLCWIHRWRWLLLTAGLIMLCRLLTGRQRMLGRLLADRQVKVVLEGELRVLLLAAAQSCWGLLAD